MTPMAATVDAPIGVLANWLRSRRRATEQQREEIMNVPTPLKSPRVLFWLGMLCVIASVFCLTACLPLSRPAGFSDKAWFVHQVNTSNAWIAMEAFAFLAVAFFIVSGLRCARFKHENYSER
jgi:hypothetical protein